MSTQFDQVAADAMKLPLRERVRLAQQLVSTLDETLKPKLRNFGLLKQGVDWMSFTMGRLRALKLMMLSGPREKTLRDESYFSPGSV